MLIIRHCVAAWALYLLTTFLCGTVAWVIWALACRLLQDKGVNGALYAAGRLAQWLYILPLIQGGWAVYTMAATEFRWIFGRATPAVERALLALFVLWAAGFLWALGKKCLAVRQKRRLARTCNPCTGERAELFRRACWRIGIAGEISLYQGEAVETPFLRGVFARRMYLPEGEVTQEAMQDFLLNCRWGRRCMAAAGAYGVLVHWYSPFIKRLERYMAEEAGAPELKEGKCAGVCGVCMALILSLQIALCGFCAVQFLEGYTRIDRLTADVVVVEGEVSEPPKEYVTKKEDPGIEIEDDVVEIEDTEGAYDVNWYIYPGTRKQSPVICGEAGKEISVLVMGTEGVPFKCGILYEDGTRQYAMGEDGALCTTFTLRQTGDFRFFAQNEGEEKLEFTAMFRVMEE